MTLPPVQPGQNSNAKAPSPWLKRALIASLAVNLLIVGSVVGHWGWGPHSHGRGYGGGTGLGILGYARKLEPERRKAIRKIVRESRPNLKTLREDLRLARIGATEALVVQPFDKEKVRTALARIGEVEAQIKAVGLDTFLNASELLTDEERAGLVEWWKHRRPYHFRPRAAKRKSK